MAKHYKRDLNGIQSADPKKIVEHKVRQTYALFLLRHSKRVGVAIIGGLVIIIGLILIPYPGPGWLIVFGGLAVLATEFKFAAKVLEKLKEKYEAWKIWVKHQPLVLEITILICTGIIILVTVWLLNTFGLIDNFFHLHKDWLHSPILRRS